MKSISCRVALALAGTVALMGCNTAPTGQPSIIAASPSASASPSPAPTSSCTTENALATWTVKKLAMQTIVVPVQENSVSAVSAEVAAGAGGVILFGSQAPASLGAALAQLVGKAPDGIAPFIMTDEEGGTVQRMPNIVGKIPSARTMARTMTPAQIRALARQAGTKMKAAGVTMDLAPVLDLDDRAGPNASNPDGTRSFSIDPKKASAAGLAFAQGLQDAGVVPVVKHFPGLGHATANTDLASAATKPWDALQKADLLPFQDAVEAGLPAVMIANATVPGLSTLPATIAPEVVTTVLRERLGFDGLVITDSLSATAVAKAGYPVPKASVRAIVAGNDMILFTAAAGKTSTVTNQVTQAIVAAVESGELTRARLEDAVAHILTAKKVNLCA